jgi:hypothetical protein
MVVGGEESGCSYWRKIKKTLIQTYFQGSVLISVQLIRCKVFLKKNRKDAVFLWPPVWGTVSIKKK